MTGRIDARMAQAERPCLAPMLKTQHFGVNPDVVLFGICQSLSLQPYAGSPTMVLVLDDGQSGS